MDRGVILNGLTSLGFDGAFTRMPNRTLDCPGVLDYVIGPLSVVRLFPVGALQVLDSPVDLSDHYPVALAIGIDSDGDPTTRNADQFSTQRLPALKIPADATTWDAIEKDVSAELASTALANSLQRCLEDPCTSLREAQDCVNTTVSEIVAILYNVFGRFKLIKKRSFGPCPMSSSDCRKAATPALRRIRSEASHARRSFIALTRTGAPHEALTAAKRSWNQLSARCRAESRSARAGLCSEWRSLWSQLRSSAPRQLWKTFRMYTHQQTEEATSTPDQQWDHWASQGLVQESVWNDTIRAPATAWIETLREHSPATFTNEPVSTAEVKAAAKRLRPGRAPGIDGIPSDIISRLQGMLNVITMLFSIMLKFSVYPTALGVALIRGILKSGKARDLPSSLRGIRLICSLSAWFGQIIDQRARRVWQAGSEQFGFRSAVGCPEAVAVLLALIQSRTLHKKRLFILWVDLRTAFPSLDRAILLRRVFLCGLGAGFCKMLLSIFDATVSVLCIGTLLGKRFRETLGTREGAVEPPHLFNIYIGDLRRRLEQQHPRLCQLMHITVAILLYADDAALPADTAEDLALSARIFEEFCNDMRLYVSVPKTFVTVFHDTSDDEVKYVGNNVLVDGHRVVVKIYGSEINATASFKYLGVVLDASGSPAAHLDARFAAFERAGNGLINGLRRIPAHTHSFVQYLWQALVLPVALYGVELFAWAEKDQSRFMSLQRGLGRRLLKLGGRAPNDVTDHLLGVRSCTIEWRTGRVSLLLRLLNAPTDSWQHAALLFYFTNNTDWYRAGLEDLCRVFPLVNLNLGHNLENGQPFVYSTGDWVEKE